MTDRQGWVDGSPDLFRDWKPIWNILLNCPGIVAKLFSQKSTKGLKQELKYLCRESKEFWLLQYKDYLEQLNFCVTLDYITKVGQAQKNAIVESL